MRPYHQNSTVCIKSFYCIPLEYCRISIKSTPHCDRDTPDVFVDPAPLGRMKVFDHQLPSSMYQLASS